MPTHPCYAGYRTRIHVELLKRKMSRDWLRTVLPKAWLAVAIPAFCGPLSAQIAGPTALGSTIVCGSPVTLGEGPRRLQSSSGGGCDGRAASPWPESGAAGSGEAAVPPDLAIARAIRASDLQENGTAQAVAGVFRIGSLPGTLLLAGALYGIGELDDRPELSDLGLHTGQAIIGAGAVTVAGKLVAGRARPHASPEDASDFAFGRGIRGDDFQSFPSAHTAAAFAAGTVVALDIAERHPDSAPWAYPAIYAAAGMAGLSRLFDEEHWASDILTGAIIGIAAGLIVDD